MKNSKPFLGDIHNPFALQVFTNNNDVNYEPLQKNQFSIVTVWGGELILESENERLIMCAGESAIIASDTKKVSLKLQNKNGDEANAAIFALNDEVL